MPDLSARYQPEILEPVPPVARSCHFIVAAMFDLRGLGLGVT